MTETLAVSDRVCGGIKTSIKRLCADPMQRDHSWGHCYAKFREARSRIINNEILDECYIDNLALHMGFYLASYGMYRGSSFILEKDYKVHVPAVRELLKKEYAPLDMSECTELRDLKNRRLLALVYSQLGEYYKRIRSDVMGGNAPKTDVSVTLITKIIMGAYGCIPAYDTYFMRGLKETKIASQTYGLESLGRLVDFYEANIEALDELRDCLSRISGVDYPQMRVLDLGLWQIGFDVSSSDA